MGIFRCDHQVKPSDMKNLTAEKSDHGAGPYQMWPAVRVEYTGFCRRCKALVKMREWIDHSALTEFFKRVEKTPE